MAYINGSTTCTWRPMSERLMTVVETQEFIRRAAACLSEQAREAFIPYIAAYPEVGVIVPDTGGVRKVRWGIASRGKRGGVRVMYYYHSIDIPIFLLTVYAKNEKDDLSEKEKQAIKQLVKILVGTYQRGKTHGNRWREHYRRP
jgi:hypothetical protein